MEELLVSPEMTQAKGCTDGGESPGACARCGAGGSRGAGVNEAVGGAFLWCAGFLDFESSADLLGSVCGMFQGNAFSICGLTVLFGSAMGSKAVGAAEM
ncbi:hypothetical protein VYU27_000350 [Nannochloropsis oceanica]